jgi:chemotaxis response regulator CheB
MTGRNIVVGTSAGGIEALKVLVGGLPPDFAARPHAGETAREE